MDSSSRAGIAIALQTYRKAVLAQDFPASKILLEAVDHGFDQTKDAVTKKKPELQLRLFELRYGLIIGPDTKATLQDPLRSAQICGLALR